MAAKRTLKYYNLDEETEKLIIALQRANLVELRRVGENLFLFDKKDENDAEFNRDNGRYNYSQMSADGKSSRMFLMQTTKATQQIHILDSYSYYTESNVYCENTTEVVIYPNGRGVLKSNSHVSLVFDYDFEKGKISDVRTAAEEITRSRIKNSNFSDEVKEVLLGMANQGALQVLAQFDSQEVEKAFYNDEIILVKYNEKTGHKLSLQINARGGVFVQKVESFADQKRERTETLSVIGTNYVHKTITEANGKTKETYVPLKDVEITK